MVLSMIREGFYYDIICQSISCAGKGILLSIEKYILKAKQKEIKQLEILSKNERDVSGKGLCR